MVIKRKSTTVARSLVANARAKLADKKANGVMKKPAGAAQTPAKDLSEEVSESEPQEEVERPVSKKLLKKPAAAKKTMEAEESDEDNQGEESEGDDSEEQDADAQIVAFEGEKKEASEKEIEAARAKELKALPAEGLKELMLSNGLEKGTKEVMIKTLLKHEAKLRMAAQEQKAKIRAVVIKKKQELEGLSIPELGKLCNDKGLKGLKSKPERVQRLLVQWQEEDGVDKALAEIAQEERKQELTSNDEEKLRKLCNKMGVDPYVKEVMVERISKLEHMQGCYSRPAVKGDQEAATEDKVDMVEALLANEAQRKKQMDSKRKQEEALLSKRKELKALSVEDLKKRLTKKGLDASGKRDDMIEALFIASVQEDAAVARKSELLSKSIQELKELLSRNGLETGGKEQMVKTMLAYEAKCAEDLKAFELKVEQEAKKKEEQLLKQSNGNLKEICVEKGLLAKGDKEERVQRILEAAKTEHEFDKAVSADIRNKRKEELMSKEKAVVLKLCDEKDVNPFIKDIMIERIMTHESEGGEAIVATDAEHPAKKLRASRK